MKIALNNETSSNLFLRAPINFWETQEEEMTSVTNGQSHKDVTIHEVKYDPSKSKEKSGTYKVYLEPFGSGMPEQWLKFKAKLNIIITGNGLAEDGPARFNVTRSSLKDEALRVFEDKAKELSSETTSNHCLQAITEHVFPHMALQCQQRFMRNNVFLHLRDRTISKFCARWTQLDDYLNEFPPFKPNQWFQDDEIKDIIYDITPHCWKSQMEKVQYDPIDHTLADLFDLLERYQIAEQLDPPKQNQVTNELDESIKTKDKSRKNKRKEKSSGNDSSLMVCKRFCILHQKDDHWTDDCSVVKKQVAAMRAGWSNQTPAEWSCKKHEQEQQQKKEKNELHEANGNDWNSTFHERIV